MFFSALQPMEIRRLLPRFCLKEPPDVPYISLATYVGNVPYFTGCIDKSAVNDEMSHKGRKQYTAK